LQILRYQSFIQSITLIITLTHIACITVITNYTHCAVLLTKAAHDIACYYTAQKFVMFTNANHWTLFLTSSVQYTHHVCHMSTLILSSCLSPHLSFDNFYDVSYITPLLYIVSPNSVVFFHVFGSINKKKSSACSV
jgi:hypothetical protein